jgi:hypothetical protein
MAYVSQSRAVPLTMRRHVDLMRVTGTGCRSAQR